jgi:nucleoside-diphosphate-sugar epimerase
LKYWFSTGEVSHSIDRVYAIDKAVKELGYQPQFNIEQMLAEA